jgi:hypothetical protein
VGLSDKVCIFKTLEYSINLLGDMVDKPLNQTIENYFTEKFLTAKK